MILRRRISRKDSKTKCKLRKEFLGPQARSRVTPCSPAPNHTRGEVIRPPSQIENNSYSVIRTRDLDDLSCTRCAPTIAARPSRKCIFNKDKLSVLRVLKYGGGGEGGELCLTESAIKRFRSRIRKWIIPLTDKSDLNEECKINICGNSGQLRLSGLVKHEDSDTAQRSYQLHVSALG